MKNAPLLLVLVILNTGWCTRAAQPLSSTRQGREKDPDSTLVGLCEALEYPCLIGTVLPHPSDCQLYLQCVFPGVGELGVSNNWIVRSCSQGTWFDRRQLFCVLPSGVECAEKCEITAPARGARTSDKQGNSTDVAQKPQVQQPPVLPETEKEDEEVLEMPSSIEGRRLRLAETLYGSLPKDFQSELSNQDDNSDIPSGMSQEELFSELYKNFEALRNEHEEGFPGRYQGEGLGPPPGGVQEEQQGTQEASKVRGIDAKQAPMGQGGAGEPFWWTEFNLPDGGATKDQTAGNSRVNSRRGPQTQYQEPRQAMRDNQDMRRPARDNQNTKGARRVNQNAPAENYWGPEARNIENPPRENVHWPPMFSSPTGRARPEAKAERKFPSTNFEPTPVPIPAPSTLKAPNAQITSASRRVQSTDTAYLNIKRFAASTIGPAPRRGTPGGKYTLSQFPSTKSPYGGFNRDPLGTTEAPRTVMPWSLFYKLLRKYATVDGDTTSKEEDPEIRPFGATTADPLYSNSEVRNKEEFVHPITDLDKIPAKGRRSSGAPLLLTGHYRKPPSPSSSFRQLPIQKSVNYGTQNPLLPQQNSQQLAVPLLNHRSYIDPTIASRPSTNNRPTGLGSQGWEEAVGLLSNKTVSKALPNAFGKVSPKNMKVTTAFSPNGTSMLSDSGSSVENQSGGASSNETLRKLARMMPELNINELDPKFLTEILKNHRSADLLEPVTVPTMSSTSTIGSSQATTNTLTSAGTTTQALLPATSKQNDTEGGVKTLRIPMSRFESMMRNSQRKSAPQPSSRAAERIRELYRYLRRRMRLQGYRPVLKIAEWQTTPSPTLSTVTTESEEDITSKVIKTAQPEGKSFKQVTNIANSAFMKKDISEESLATPSESQPTSIFSTTIIAITTSKRTPQVKSLSTTSLPISEFAKMDSRAMHSMTDASDSQGKQEADSRYSSETRHNLDEDQFQATSPGIFDRPLKKQVTESTSDKVRYMPVKEQDKEDEEESGELEDRQQEMGEDLDLKGEKDSKKHKTGKRQNERKLPESSRGNRTEQNKRQQQKENIDKQMTREETKDLRKIPVLENELNLMPKAKRHKQKQLHNPLEEQHHEKLTAQKNVQRQAIKATQPQPNAHNEPTTTQSQPTRITRPAYIESEEIDVLGLSKGQKSEIIKDVIKDSYERNTDFSAEAEPDERDVFHTLSPIQGKAVMARMQPVTVEYGHVAMPPAHKGDSSSFEMVYSVSKEHKEHDEIDVSEEEVTVVPSYSTSGKPTASGPWKPMTIATVPGAMPPHGMIDVMPPYGMPGDSSKYDRQTPAMKGTRPATDLTGEISTNYMKESVPTQAVPTHYMTGAMPGNVVKGEMPRNGMKGAMQKHMKGAMPTNGLKGAISPRGMKGATSADSVKGTIPIDGMKGEIATHDVKARIPMDTTKGSMSTHGIKGATPSHGMKGTMSTQGIPYSHGLSEAIRTNGMKGKMPPHDIAHNRKSSNNTKGSMPLHSRPERVQPQDHISASVQPHEMHRKVLPDDMYETIPSYDMPEEIQPHGTWRQKVEHKMLKVPLDSEERDSHLFEHIHPEPIHTKEVIEEKGVIGLGNEETTSTTTSDNSRQLPTEDAVRSSEAIQSRDSTTLTSSEQSATTSYNKKDAPDYSQDRLRILSSPRKPQSPATGYNTFEPPRLNELNTKPPGAIDSISSTVKDQTTGATFDTTPEGTPRSSEKTDVNDNPPATPRIEKDTLDFMHFDNKYLEKANDTENATELNIDVTSTTLTVSVHSEGLSIGLIVGVSFVSILLMTIAILPCLFCTVYKKDRRKIKDTFMDHTDITTLASYGTTERTYPSNTLTSVGSYRPLIRTPSWINKILLFKKLNRKSASDHCLVNMYHERQQPNDDLFGCHDNRSYHTSSVSLDRQARKKRKSREISSRVGEIISDFPEDNSFYLKRPKVKSKHYMPSVV